MKTGKRWLSMLLGVLLALTCCTQAFAADGGTPYHPAARAADNLLGQLHDAVFCGLQSLAQTLFLREQIPTASEYNASVQPYLNPGTDGTVSGVGWRVGFANGSIIPVEWRRDASGQPDPNGFCLDKPRATGGYPFVLTEIYTDQMLNLLLLSNRCDANGNGIDDMVAFISVDGVGIARGTVKKIRAAVEQALSPRGVEKADILLCSVSATHCHVALDTQGMAFRRAELFTNGLRFRRSLNPTMENTIVSRAADCAAQAYGKMENGELTYFETEPVRDAADKLDSGVRTQNRFACFLFTGESGEKTVLANLAAHPTRYYNGRALYADYPYLMQLAMQDAGYHFLFVQSAQANINSPNPPENTDEALRKEADAWAQSHALTREDWLERYGKRYTDQYFADNEKFNETIAEEQMANAYLLTRMILDASSAAAPVAPTLEIRVAQTPVKLEYGIMSLACASGMLGEDTVIDPKAEAGYSVMAETDYIAVGDDVVILTAPCELSPSIAYGTNPAYAGGALWTGKTSWTGEDWPYDTLESMVRKATGDADKTVLIYGVTNDALAYVYPDICCTQSILGAQFFYKVKPDAMANCMLLTPGAGSGSQLVEGYKRQIETRPVQNPS